MGIYIRIDVDKPYGHKNYFYKFLSKISENYFSIDHKSKYLFGLKSLLKVLNNNHISSNIYFRNCTIPDDKVKDLLKKGQHSVGFHAENTKSKETFSKELDFFQSNSNLKVSHFTKHGSGKLKLGKYHYPNYEPEKYKIWAKDLNLKYVFGNSTLSDVSKKSGTFIEEMFWCESWYRNSSYNSIERLAKDALINDYVVLIHPSNYETFTSVKNDFNYLLELIKNNNISIKIVN